ncbi:MAG: hypothetical protein K1X79_08985 [Oligoflexia bacterium]|nr:hypothetical protein [Oligoflexia bacterium]
MDLTPRPDDTAQPSTGGPPLRGEAVDPAAAAQANHPEVTSEFLLFNRRIDSCAVLRFWATQFAAAITATHQASAAIEISQIRQGLQALVLNLFPISASIQFRSATEALHHKLTDAEAIDIGAFCIGMPQQDGKQASDIQALASALTLIEELDAILEISDEHQREAGLKKFVHFLDTGERIDNIPEVESIADRDFASLLEEAALRLTGALIPHTLDTSIFNLAFENSQDRMLFWAGLDIARRFASSTAGLEASAFKDARANVIEQLGLQAALRVQQLRVKDVSWEVGGIYRALAAFSTDAIPTFVKCFKFHAETAQPNFIRTKEVIWALYALEHVPTSAIKPFLRTSTPTQAPLPAKAVEHDIIDAVLQLTRHQFESVQTWAVATLLYIAPDDRRAINKLDMLEDNFAELPDAVKLLVELRNVMTNHGLNASNLSQQQASFAAWAQQEIQHLPAKFAQFVGQFRPVPRIVRLLREASPI